MDRTVLLVSALMACGFSYSEAHTILTKKAESDYAARVEAQKSIKKHLDFKKGTNPEERDALKFLYAYMATPDALDYDADFYLMNIRSSLRAAKEMPWGKSVPDREWRHFVLPVRVNNEDLDLSRPAFYDELKDRVKGLSMKEAILEVNHWCHEKVSYQPSDARTSSPLATVCNALGRCGEESTFTVAALRSVGIPARQVYTPRWAHTDDNHAWVEAWADGQWYFLGACEPEAVLDLAWFNAPASRGMLMNTKVVGAYDGPEEQLERNATSTIINVTDKYAPTVTSKVIVTDLTGKPAENATVNFSLYNYAEFFPIAVKKTDANGYAELLTGNGDLMIWASDGKRFGMNKSSSDTLRLVLDKGSDFTGAMDFDIVPPPAGVKLPYVSPEAAALNDRRKIEEDAIRNAYVGTFLSEDKAQEICRRLGLEEKAVKLLVDSRGNHKTIVGFLESAKPSERKKAVALLSAINEKDLHDITTAILYDHLATPEAATPLFDKYIMNPRIQTEGLTPYKSFFAKALTSFEKKKYATNPRELEKWMAANVSIDKNYNPLRYRTSPESVWKTRIADPVSRSIAFVAVCRSIGVPARIDQVSGATQFADADGKWHDVTFGNEAKPLSAAKGKIKIVEAGSKLNKEPKYYSQFSISRIENGLPELLDFDEFETLSSINERQEPFAPGQYVLVSGQRLADGTVLCRSNFFVVNPDETTTVDLVVRQDTTALQVIGSLNAELPYRPFGDGEPTSLISTTGRGYYVLALVAPGHEPSAHALNDIAAAAADLERTGRKIMVVFPDEESASRFKKEDYGKLPSNVVFGIDVDGGIAKDLKSGLELKSEEKPIIVVADTFNRIVFCRQGYSIHIGEQLYDVLSRLKE